MCHPILRDVIDVGMRRGVKATMWTFLSSICSLLLEVYEADSERGEGRDGKISRWKDHTVVLGERRDNGQW